MTERRMAVGVEDVWAVLSDGDAYPRWVVGASHARAVDPEFPAPGSRFHHAVGMWPLQIGDHTEVLEVDPPRRIVLRAHARPLGTACVEIDVEPDGEGCRVRLHERAGGPLTHLVLNPLTYPLTSLRNAIGLRRLERLALDVSRRRRSSSSSRA